MVDIESYDFQKRTNIKEHNDLVAKINEIVDVINNTNLDTILPKISKLETDVSTIKATDSLQWTDIENLKTKNTEYDTHFGLNDTQIDGITKSLVSDVALMNGTTTGNVKIRIEREDAPSIDSDDYNIQKPTSVELVQGTAPSMMKAQITLSDGTVLISNDFMFTTEAIGQDVYISSFVFKNGDVAGTISADIGLSNGSTLTANNFVVPTDPNVTSAISDLQTRMTSVEGGSVGGLDELKAQVQTNTTNIGTLTTEIDDLDIRKADIDNSNQTIVAGTITATNITKGGVNVATVNDIPVVPDISGKVDIAQGTENAGKALVVGLDGNVTPAEVGGGKKLYTGSLSDLISFSYVGTNGPNTISILKDFDIEYIVAAGAYIYSVTASVKKFTGSYTGAGGTFYLGIANPCQSAVASNTDRNYIYINVFDGVLNSLHVKVSVGTDSSTTPTQLITDDPIPMNQKQYFYKIYTW